MKEFFMRLSSYFAGGLMVLASLTAGAQPRPAEISAELLAQAESLAQSALIIDTHIDVPYRLHDAWEDVSQSAPGGEFDFPRAIQGGLNLPFMSIYTPSTTEDEGSSFQLANQLIDSMEALVGRAPDQFIIVRNPAEALQAKAAGKIGIALGMENGSPVDAKLENIQFFHDRGVRYITLAHGLSNHISDSSYDKSRQWNGLSPFGREVVAEMNRLGIMVDISHVSDEAFFQAVEISKVPVIASHSSARHFTPGFERNMSDEMIVALAKQGGVIQINYASSFLTAEANAWQVKMAEERTAWLEASGNTEDSEATKAWVKAYREESPYPYASLADVADHFDHVIKLVGYEHVGIGSDFDGVGDSLPEGLKDVTTYPALIAELLHRGYTEEQLIAILGGNLMRVWGAVEAYAQSQAVSLASPAALYCQYLGGESVSEAAAGGGQVSACRLPDGQSCEQWALYRGSCALNAEIKEPFAFCAAIGNSPVLPAAGGEPARLLPQALLASMRTQGLSNSEMPDYVQAAAHWRCMNSEVYVCPVGANLPCEEPANLSQTPRKAMQEFCTENPDADGMPAYVTGRATVYNWNCIDGQAVVGEQRFTADAQGYLAEFWHRLSRLKSVAVEP
jgi:membrane dipeptidase